MCSFPINHSAWGKNPKRREIGMSPKKYPVWHTEEKRTAVFESFSPDLLYNKSRNLSGSGGVGGSASGMLMKFVAAEGGKWGGLYLLFRNMLSLQPWG